MFCMLKYSLLTPVSCRVVLSDVLFDEELEEADPLELPGAALAVPLEEPDVLDDELPPTVWLVLACGRAQLTLAMLSSRKSASPSLSVCSLSWLVTVMTRALPKPMESSSQFSKPVIRLAITTTEVMPMAIPKMVSAERPLFAKRLARVSCIRSGNLICGLRFLRFRQR